LTVVRSDAPRIRVPVLLGPTASGKTDFALGLSQDLGLEIISCDSRQIYRFMNIGTAKPTGVQQGQVRHWMIDIINPEERFSCFQYARQTETMIRDGFSAGKSFLICGGSGLYYKGLSEGIAPTFPPSDEFRKKYREKACRPTGAMEIYEELLAIDESTALSSSPSNIQRNIRALEIFWNSGIPQSQLKKQTQGPADIEFKVMVAALPREELYRRIDDRVDAMIKGGLNDEFKMLRAKGYDEFAPGLHSLGYKELFPVENNAMSLPRAVEIIKMKTRNYAKRQITWFKHQVRGVEFPIGRQSFDRMKKMTETFLRP
jgi:tRNA dimethylallyltransferase